MLEMGCGVSSERESLLLPRGGERWSGNGGEMEKGQNLVFEDLGLCGLEQIICFFCR